MRRVVHLIRHAQSNWNVVTHGEHVGARPKIIDRDSRLSDLGKEQASALQKATIIPPPELVLSSPLSRALSTAVALSNGTLEIHAEPLATEWCENSCDVGRPAFELQAEYGDHVRKLGEIGAQWWPLSEADIAAGGRESEQDVDDRAARIVARLQQLPYTSIALVSHCMILQKVQQALEGSEEPPPFLSNAEIRTIAIQRPDSSGPSLKP